MSRQGKIFVMLMVIFFVIFLGMETMRDNNPDFVSFGSANSMTMKTANELIINSVGGNKVEIKYSSSTEIKSSSPAKIDEYEDGEQNYYFPTRVVEIVVPSGSVVNFRRASDFNTLHLSIKNRHANISIRAIWQDEGGAEGDLKDATLFSQKLVEANSIEITVDEPDRNAILDVPSSVTEISFEKIRHILGTPIRQSALEGADVHFFKFGYPIKVASVKPKEWLEFYGLNGVVTEISIKGETISFSLRGRSKSIVAGFENYRSDLRPSWWEIAASMPNVSTFVAALFSVYIALLGAARIFRDD